MALDIFGGLLGQQQKPNLTTLDPSQVLSGVSGQVPAINNINQQFGTGTANTARSVEDILYPGMGNLQSATTKSIADELGLGGNLPQDVKQQVMQGALAGNVSSGFNLGPGGRGMVARDLGLTGLQLQNQRQQNAANWVTSQNPTGTSLSISHAMDPNSVAGMFAQQNAQQNQIAQNNAAIDSANSSAIWSSLAKYAGMAMGAAAGNPMALMGAAGGGAPAAGSNINFGGTKFGGGSIADNFGLDPNSYNLQLQPS